VGRVRGGAGPRVEADDGGVEDGGGTPQGGGGSTGAGSCLVTAPPPHPRLRKLVAVQHKKGADLAGKKKREDFRLPRPRCDT